MKEPIDQLREDAAEATVVRQLSVFFLANGNTAAQVFYIHDGDDFEDLPYEWRITHKSDTDSTCSKGVTEVINKRLVAYYRDRMLKKRKLAHGEKSEDGK